MFFCFFVLAGEKADCWLDLTADRGQISRVMFLLINNEQ
jgi:hypothetical protein